MNSSNTVKAPASRSPSPTLHLPSGDTSHATADATSSSCTPSDMRKSFSGVQDDSFCLSSSPRQLHRNTSNSSCTSSPATRAYGTNREYSCLSTSSHQLLRTLSRSALRSSSPTHSLSNNHRERNPTSQLSTLFSGIRGESSHCGPYQVHTL